MSGNEEQDFPTQELPAQNGDSPAESDAAAAGEPAPADDPAPADKPAPADEPPAAEETAASEETAAADEPSAEGPGVPLNIADVLAKLKGGNAAADAAPNPAQGDDIGSPEADVLAQAAEVLDGAAHTVQTEHLLAERTADLQRLQAEYANYRKRVERDRATARTQGVESVIREMMPVFDGISHAQEHEELTGGFKVVASELARVMTNLGLTDFGAVGDEFDPNLHEALMQIPSEDVPAGHIAQVIQPGYKLGETVLRPARVAVASEPN